MKPKDVKIFLRELSHSTNDQIKIDFFDDSNFNIFYIKVVPCKGYYAHASFRFKIDMNVIEDNSQPNVTCITSIYHPNIDLTQGENVCINLLNSWNKKNSLTDLANAILYLFYEPNFADPIYNIFVPPDSASFEKLVKASLMGAQIGKHKYEANPDWIEWSKKNKPENLITLNAKEISEMISSTFGTLEKLENESNNEELDLSNFRSDSHCSDVYTNFVNPHIQSSALSEESCRTESSLNSSLCTLYVDLPMEKVYINWIAEDLNEESNNKSTYYFVLAYETSETFDSFNDKGFIPIDVETQVLRTIQIGSKIEWSLKCDRRLVEDLWETYSSSEGERESCSDFWEEKSFPETEEKLKLAEKNEEFEDDNKSAECEFHEDIEENVDDTGSEFPIASTTLKIIKANLKPLIWFFYQTYFLPDLLPGSIITLSKVKKVLKENPTFCKSFCHDLECIIKPVSNPRSEVEHVIVADTTAVWVTAPNLMHLTTNQNDLIQRSGDKMERCWRVIEWLSPINSFKKNDRVNHLRVTHLSFLSWLVNTTNFLSWLHRLEIGNRHGILWSENRSVLSSIFVRSHLGLYFTNLDIWPIFLMKESCRQFTILFARLFCRSMDKNKPIQFGYVNRALNAKLYQRFA